MDYSGLNDFWKKQREQYQLWELRLLQYASHVREFVEKQLSPPAETWLMYDTKEQHRYVELVDFYKKDKPVRKAPTNTSITSEGMLAFGISITFAHGENTYPKQNLFVPVVVRYFEKRIEIGFFDIEKDEVDGGWYSDIETFYTEFVERLGRYLSHDPHDGFSTKKRKIGFID